MQTYRLSLPKRLFGWVLTAAAACAVAALAIRAFAHGTAVAGEELAAGAVIGVFIVLIGTSGLTFVRFAVRFDDDALAIRALLRERRLSTRDLAGYGLFVLVVNFVPMTYVRLYGKGLREIARFPIARRHREEVQAWLAARLPEVVDEGSLIRPRPRIVASPQPAHGRTAFPQSDQ